jgi:hypothetical protein
MIPEDIRPLVFALINKSEIRKVNWKHASESMPESLDEDYIVNGPKSSINIFKSDNGIINFHVLNDRGDIIVKFETLPEERDYEKLEKLLELAKKKSLNLEDTIKDLLNSINNSDVFGDDESF